MEFAASLYGFNSKVFRPNRGEADMSGVLLASQSGEVLSPLKSGVSSVIPTRPAQIVCSS
jgi:hypothetical protein